ncbi:MAG: histidinol-phosphatase HisJ family protein [Clostridiales bacterium]|jgi:histidinol-phosphatase (PHP family)|nr:histidinol-phosphatase HisJ family protein [Clostridiales bacterium]
MNLYDCHVHSTFSTDGESNIEEMVSFARHLELTGITFTDHLDLDYPGMESDFQLDFDEYFTQLRKLKNRYKNSLSIYIGVESGIQPHIADATTRLIKDRPFDFVINSTHIVKGQDVYCPNFFTDKIKKEAYTEYLEEIYNNIQIFEDYDILGHFGYITRYAPYSDTAIEYKDYADIFDNIFKLLISLGKGIEFNTRDYSCLNTHLDTDIFKRYHELGGEILTIGSDAHNCKNIGKNFKKILPVIKDSGFNYLSFFDKREVKFYKI